MKDLLQTILENNFAPTLTSIHSFLPHQTFLTSLIMNHL